MSGPARFALSGPGGAVLVLLIGLVLYVPSFGTGELDDEEGRRAIPAREMLESGDFVLPTIWGRPYLNKPPMFFWLVAASSTLTGGVDEAATRLPSVVATLLTALTVLAVGRRIAGPRTALVSALIFLCTLAVFEKGAFGELEATLTLAVFGSTASLLVGEHSRRPLAWSLASGLLLAAALLTKGPPVLVFFFAMVIAIAVARRRARYLVSLRPWLAFGVGAALASVWVVLLLSRPEVQDAIAHWGDEMARGGTDLAEYVKRRRRLATGVLIGFFPASFLWLASLGTPARRACLEDPVRRVAGTVVVLGLVFFALVPGTATRYVHPLLPWACLATGQVVAAALESREPVFERRARRVGRLVAALGLAVAGGAAWLSFGSIATIDHLGPVGWTLAALALALSLATWRAWSRGIAPRALWLTLGVLACVRLIQLAEVVPQTAALRGREVAAEAIARHLPDGAPLFVGVPFHYNTLFYVRRPMVAVDDPLDAPAGAALVVAAQDVEALRESRGLDARPLVTVPTWEGGELTLLRVAP